MAKLKNPLLSLGALGSVAKALTFARRRRTNIAQQFPYPDDPRTLAQLSWRHMYQKAVALWHALSAAEQRDWQSQASARHMTGFAWFMSQALKPNPGLYLPLQGGTMSGDITMDDNRILTLPAPVDSQEPLRLSEYTTLIAPYLYNEGARIHNSAPQTIPTNTVTPLAFDSELYDTDNIHDNTVNNSRLTCKTPGKYIITASAVFLSNPTGNRQIEIFVNGTSAIALVIWQTNQTTATAMTIAAIYNLALNDYVQIRVWHTRGIPLDIAAIGQYTPISQMQRIGA